MSAKIYWDFAVEQWAATITTLVYTGQREEANRRADALPLEFKKRVIANIEGVDRSGEPY